METKLPFFQRPEFQVWLITAFFTVLVNLLLVFLPALGIECIGNAVAAEFDSVRPARPVMPTVPSPEPERAGFPVAFTNTQPGEPTDE